MFVNFFRNEPPLLEAEPQGEASVEIKLDERAARVLAALLALESLEVSSALAALFVAGTHAGERSVRGR